MYLPRMIQNIIDYHLFRIKTIKLKKKKKLSNYEYAKVEEGPQYSLSLLNIIIVT